VSHKTVNDSFTGRDARRFVGPIVPAEDPQMACQNCGGDLGLGPRRRFCSSRCLRHAIFTGSVPPPTCAICGREIEPRHTTCGESCQVVLIDLLRAESDGFCWLCGESVEPGLIAPDERRGSADHFIPHVAGGESTLDNLRLAHFICNQQKGEAIPLEDGSLVPFVHPDLRLLYGEDSLPDNLPTLTHWYQAPLE
jgi:5-methylcytosine-specific restriction endonuclease McrA